MVVATLGVLALRLLLAARVPGPFQFHDEGGYVAVARWLVGESPTHFGPAYAPGLGLLLAPLAAVGDADVLQRGTQVLLAVAGAVLVPALWRLGRLVGSPPTVAVGAAVAGAVTAGSLVQSTMLVPEVLFALATVGVLLVLHRAVAGGRPVVAAGLGIVVAAQYLLHPRGLVTVLAVAAAVGAAVRAGRLPAPRALLAGGCALVVAGAGTLLGGAATDAIHPDGPSATLRESPAAALTEPIGTLVAGLGQLWYLLVASVGLAALGAVAAVRLARRSGPVGAVGVAVAVGLAGSLALGAAASHHVGAGIVGRADQPVYGRYLEQWLPVLVALAPVAFTGASRRLRTGAVASAVATVAVAGIVVRSVHEAGVWVRPIAWNNIASLRLPWELLGDDHVLATTLIAAIAAGALCGPLVVAASPRRWIAPVAALVALNLLGGVQVVEEWARPAAAAWDGRHRLAAPLAEAGEPVVVRADEAFEVFWAYNAQFWEPDVEVRYERRRGPRLDGPLHLGSTTEPPRPGAVLVGTEIDGDLGLWASDPEVAARLRAILAGTPAAVG